MANREESTKELYDAFLSMEAGVNTNVAPFSLPKNQLGGAINASMRGQFVVPRSPYQQIALAAGLPQALFQGACYYSPDSGPESLVVQIGGRLFQITPSATAATATVTEITIPGDPNPPQTSIAWLWQAEKWVIVQDGTSIPIFFDGTDTPNTTRRSAQTQPSLYTLGAQFLAPRKGASVTVQLSAPYTQGPNYPIVVSDSPNADIAAVNNLYTATPQTGAILTLQNVTGVPGSNVAAGTNLYTNTSFLGFIYKVTNFVVQLVKPSDQSNFWVQTVSYVLILTQEYPPAPGAPETEFPVTIVTESLNEPSPPTQPTVGPPFYTTPKSANVIIATTQNSSAGTFTVPAVGQTAQVTIQAPYTGNLDDIIYINGKTFTVSAIDNNLSNYVVLTQTSETPSATTPVPIGTNVYPQILGNELLPGRMGCYGLGQNWYSLPNGTSFVSGDIVGSASGTPANGFRDAVLKMTTNTYLANGGNFSVPGNTGDIQAFAFIANLDVSLGQGPLQVCTEFAIYSCQVALGNTNWTAVTNPILTESLIASGAVNQNGSKISNSDLIFRAPDGVRSLILGRRDFNTWGNVPISQEVIAYIQGDNQNLLGYGSSIVFDNRFLTTANPIQAAWGVYHTSILALNFDPISSLAGKSASIWEGVWQDLNVLQLLTGKFSGTQRAFAFNYNTTSNTIELWEILPSTATSSVPIKTVVELPVWDFGEKDPRKREWKRLQDGEIYVDQIVGPVGVVAEFRPDYDSTYHPWNSFTIPAAPSYQPRIGIGKPPQSYDANSDDGGTGRFFASGFNFQTRLTFTGAKWRLMGGRAMAFRQPMPQFPPVLPATPP